MYDVFQTQHVGRMGVLEVRNFDTFEEAERHMHFEDLKPGETCGFIMGINFDLSTGEIITCDELDYFEV